MQKRVCLAVGVMIVPSALSTAAYAGERRASVTVTGGISASDNPLLSTRLNAEALLYELTIHPVLTSRTETSSAELSGSLSRRSYSREYRSYVYGSALIAGSVRKSETLELSGSAHYRHEINADVVDDVVGAIDPGSLRRSLGADAKATWHPSERSTFTPSLSAERVSFEDSARLERYDRVGGSIGYQRQLSEYSSAGAALGATVYNQGDQATSSVLSATATFQHKLSPLFEASGALGIERVGGGARYVEHPEAASTSRVFLTGNGSLCRRGEWTNLCFTGSIASKPTGLGSLERLFAGGVSYSLKIGEFSNLALSANYQHSSARNGQLDAPSYLHARLAFNRRLSSALTVDTFVDYRRRGGIAEVSAKSAGISLLWKTGRN